MESKKIRIGGILRELRHSDDFILYGKNFTIELRRTIRGELGTDFCESAWCLYVIIFPEHHLYKKAAQNNDDYDIDLGDKIFPNFHCGCTYYHKNSDAVKIGCDYQHYVDEKYYKDFSDSIPNDILVDVKELYEWFARGEE